MALIAHQFSAGSAPTLAELSNLLGVPSRLISQVLAVLTRARLVQEAGPEGAAFSPARPGMSV